MGVQRHLEQLETEIHSFEKSYTEDLPYGRHWESTPDFLQFFIQENKALRIDVTASFLLALPPGLHNCSFLGMCFLHIKLDLVSALRAHQGRPI